MKICAFVLLFGFSYVYSDEDGRGDLSDGDEDIPFSKLPVDLQSDFFKILAGTVDPTWYTTTLGNQPDYAKVELLLYTNDTETPTKLDPTNPVGIDFNAPLFLLSHGWMSGTNGHRINSFRDKYIELYGKNIIFVNWGKLAWLPYSWSYHNMPFIAQHLATFLCDLNVKHKYDLQNVHMIGHSLGGQLSGLTGKATQMTCSAKMGKITALDPAGPLYQGATEADRLAPTDAEFVEVVHSNANVLGYSGKCGTVDYHLNGGLFQPGCSIFSDMTHLAKYSIFAIICSHVRPVEIWPYVLESDQFKGKSFKACSSSPVFCAENIRVDFVSMGHTNITPKHEHYSVITGKNPPFYLGCKPYPSQGCT